MSAWSRRILSLFMTANLSYRIKLKWYKSKKYSDDPTGYKVERFWWNRNLIMRIKLENVNLNSWGRLTLFHRKVRARLAGRNEWNDWWKQKKSKRITIMQAVPIVWYGRAASRSDSPKFTINHFLYAKIIHMKAHEGRSRSLIIIWCCNILGMIFFLKLISIHEVCSATAKC